MPSTVWFTRRRRRNPTTPPPPWGNPPPPMTGRRRRPLPRRILPQEPSPSSETAKAPESSDQPRIRLPRSSEPPQNLWKTRKTLRNKKSHDDLPPLACNFRRNATTSYLILSRGSGAPTNGRRCAAIWSNRRKTPSTERPTASTAPSRRPGWRDTITFNTSDS